MKLRNIITVFVLVFGAIFSTEVFCASTPQDILSKAAGKVRGAKGVDASYSLSSKGQSLQGVLKSVGSKFYVKAGGMETWYNGKELYTYNPSSKETTVMLPSASELAEVNPLLYLNQYNQYFTPVFSKNNQAGKYIIDLNSKSRKAPAKKITVFLNAKTLAPEKFIITSQDGSVATLTITKLNFAASIGSSTFNYPKSRFPNVNIVDLR
ncbi:MAG: hypothetical protein HDS97_04750 [Bacteroidales bacterium]|nr:hypothetical protein [Bacteroidales bacterium]